MRGVFLLVFLAVFAGVMVLGQRVHAPAWLRDRVETRLDRALDGVKIRFGDASFIINEGWRPRLRLSDVSISDAEGRQIAHVSDLRASLSMRPLLRGHVRPKRIVLNGAQITLVRGPDGMLTLTVGSGSAPVRQAPNLAELIEQADAVFQSPALSALASVEMEAITLDYGDQRLGRSWVLDGGHILVTRDDRALRLATGFSVLAGRDYVSMVEANYTSTFGSPQAQFGISITDLPAVDVAAQAPALAWLQVLDAPISGALRGSIDGQGALGPVFATLNLGPGAVQPNPETRPVPFDKARTYFTYDPGRQALDFNEVSIASAWGTVQGEGEAYLEGVETGALQSMAVQVRLSGIGLNPADLFVDDLQLNRAELDFQVSLNPFRLQLGQAVVEDDDVRLHASGAVQGLPDGWSVDLDAGINRISHRRVLQYWPPRLAPKPRKWVTENVFGGQMSNVDFALRLRPGSKPQVYADFEFDEATVRFAKTLPPLQNARGEASLIERRFAVTAHQGFVKADQGGVVDAAGTSFIIPDTGIKKSTPGIARIQARGSVTAALSLLDRPPLSVLTKAKLPVDLADGQVRLSGTLALPLIKGLKLEDTRFHFAGDILNLQSERLVPGFRVSAAKLALSGTQDEVTIAGDGSFGAVPMQVRWRQPIGGTEPQRSTLTGEIELSPRLMDALKAELPPQMMAGQGVAQIELGIGGGQPTRLRASSDLAGVTLAIPELGWRKPPSGTGALTVEATVSEPLSIDTLRIEAAGLRAVGAISIKGGALDRIRFSTFELGDWLAVPAGERWCRRSGAGLSQRRWPQCSPAAIGGCRGRAAVGRVADAGAGRHASGPAGPGGRARKLRPEPEHPQHPHHRRPGHGGPVERDQPGRVAGRDVRAGDPVLVDRERDANYADAGQDPQRQRGRTIAGAVLRWHDRSEAQIPEPSGRDFTDLPGQCHRQRADPEGRGRFRLQLQAGRAGLGAAGLGQSAVGIGASVPAQSDAATGADGFGRPERTAPTRRPKSGVGYAGRRSLTGVGGQIRSGVVKRAHEAE